MSIRTVLFDIGGVLEITPATGWQQKWEATLGLPPGALDERMAHVWRAGSLGTISEAEVERQIGAILKLDPAQLGAFMADLWEEYLGELNAEMTSYFAGLRPRYQTAMLSNSFVGAREKEQARYGFGNLCELIIYSHEEGMQKPDRRFFDLACARLGARPDEILFVDDHEPNIVAARALGMQGVLFQNTAQAIADIEARLAAV